MPRCWLTSSSLLNVGYRLPGRRRDKADGGRLEPIRISRIGYRLNAHLPVLPRVRKRHPGHHEASKEDTGGVFLLRHVSNRTETIAGDDRRDPTRGQGLVPFER